MKKLVLVFGLLLLLVLSNCGGEEEQRWVNGELWEFDLWITVLETRQSYEGRYWFRYEVENISDFFVNEYTIEFEVTEYDGESFNVECKGYSIAPGQISETIIYTQVKPAPCLEEEWDELWGDYFAHVQVSNVIIHK